MQARMNNPVELIPDAMQSILALWDSVEQGSVSKTTLGLVHMRASQINGCSVCVELGLQKGRKGNETEQRLLAVSAWRDSPHFSDAERAALALTEAVTRLSDQSDPVPDHIWNEAARHYDDSELATLLVAISTVNVFNRLNVATRQVAGQWAG